MTMYFAVDKLGIYTHSVELHPLAAIPRGSYSAPPACGDNEYAMLDGHHWVKLSLQEKLDLECKAAVPASVTPRQIRQALTKTGHRERVEAAIASGTQDLKDWYERADEFQRDHPLVLELLGVLGLTERDADDVWTLAGAL